MNDTADQKPTMEKTESPANTADTADINVLNTPGGEMPDVLAIEKRRKMHQRHLAEETEGADTSESDSLEDALDDKAA